MQIVSYYKQKIILFSNKQTHTNVYGITRSLFALSTFLTLIFNDTNVLFPKESNIDFNTTFSFIQNLNLFILLKENLLLAKIFAIIILILVIIGIKPKYTVIPHWWISSSFFLNSPAIEGGDQLISIITFLLIPIGLTDKRLWHWSVSKKTNNSDYSFFLTHFT